MTAPREPAAYTRTLSRRATLEWMAAISAAIALPRGSWATASAASPPATSGYGTDPNLKEPVVPWHLVMDPHQLQQTAVLADLILPGSSVVPAPSSLGVPDFVNEWVSAPYPDQLKDQATIFDGLRWIDIESLRRGKRAFLESDQRIRVAIVGDIAQKNPQAAFSAQNAFFQRFRFLVVAGYYTTAEGLQDIGYTGNVPLATYPSMTDVERSILDSALAKLGLSS